MEKDRAPTEHSHLVLMLWKILDSSTDFVVGTYYTSRIHVCTVAVRVKLKFASLEPK